ncbi:hypothetical protein [Paeniclostridium hominis]|uniref:hypothetical protein n=1 Tax=Paeniclostridium hominis TaxID=2764329 RepID=UPI0022E0FD36|nr:hypothetical protein [Paeniclostridium hominis]
MKLDDYKIGNETFIELLDRYTNTFIKIKENNGIKLNAKEKERLRIIAFGSLIEKHKIDLEQFEPVED